MANGMFNISKEMFIMENGRIEENMGLAGCSMLKMESIMKVLGRLELEMAMAHYLIRMQMY